MPTKPPYRPSPATGTEEADSDTPVELAVESLAEAEKLRYRNYASEEAIAEASSEIRHANSKEGVARALRKLWVRGVDWGASWQAHVVYLMTGKLEAANAQVERLVQLLKRHRSPEEVPLRTRADPASERQVGNEKDSG